MRVVLIKDMVANETDKQHRAGYNTRVQRKVANWLLLSYHVSAREEESANHVLSYTHHGGATSFRGSDSFGYDLSALGQLFT